MTVTKVKPATWFWIIAVIGLLWNLAGIASFIMRITVSQETLDAMSPDERTLYSDFPLWVLITYCVAVFGSTIGNILLLMRKKSATPVLIVGFVAIILQMIYTIFMSRALELHGPRSLGVPSLVIIFGVVLIWLARTATRKGWID